MNYFATAPLIAAIANLLLALFVLYQSPGGLINRTFAVFGLSVSVWTFGAFMMFRVDNAEEALFWTRVLHVGVIFLPLSFFHLAVQVAESRVLSRPWLLYAVGVPFVAADFTPLFIKDVVFVGYGYFGVAGPLYPLFSLTIPSLSLPAFAIILRRLKSIGTGNRLRLTYLLVSAIMLFLCGLHDVLPMLGVYFYPGTRMTIYPIGTAAAIAYGCLVAYSVLQHQLLDIRLSLGRIAATFTRLLFFFSIGFSLVLTLALLRPEEFPPYAFIGTLAILLASGLLSSLFFPKLLGGRSEILERKILGDRFEYQDQVRAFVESMPEYRKIPKLLDDVAALLVDTMGISRFHLMLFNSTTQEIGLTKSWPATLENGLPAISGNHPLAQFLKTSKLASVNIESAELSGELPHHARNRKISEAYAPLRPVFCLPLRSGDEIYGLLFIGERSTGFYTALDLELIENLCSQLSRLIAELRLKEQIALTEQLESLAVMSRGLAHDLNNLITPINTYLQIEAAELAADSPKIDLHRVATKNMQTIRSYVREAVFFATTLTPNIHPVSAERLFASTAAICQLQLEKRGVALASDLPQPFDFYGDDILLQRMLANFIFNAIDASPTGGVITLRGVLLPRAGQAMPWIRFQVVDRGCGIPKENLARVFAPYFSTKDLGDQTRGFGLGLTICQKIAHLHRGTISLQSTVGQGTTMQVDLPMKPEAITSPNSP